MNEYRKPKRKSVFEADCGYYGARTRPRARTATKDCKIQGPLQSEIAIRKMEQRKRPKHT